MATLEQKRATLAWDHVQQVKELLEADRKKYGTIVHAVTSMLRTAGLSQSLHFIHARNNPAQGKLLEHLAAQLKRTDSAIRSPDTLLRRAREADMSTYLRLTQEALQCVNWYRRFVQGELKVFASDQADDRGDDHA